MPSVGLFDSNTEGSSFLSLSSSPLPPRSSPRRAICSSTLDLSHAHGFGLFYHLERCNEGMVRTEDDARELFWPDGSGTTCTSQSML